MRNLLIKIYTASTLFSRWCVFLAGKGTFIPLRVPPPPPTQFPLFMYCIQSVELYAYFLSFFPTKHAVTTCFVDLSARPKKYRLSIEIYRVLFWRVGVFRAFYFLTSSPPLPFFSLFSFFVSLAIFQYLHSVDLYVYFIHFLQ